MNAPWPLLLGAAGALLAFHASRAEPPDPGAPMRDAGQLMQQWVPFFSPPELPRAPTASDLSAAVARGDEGEARRQDFLKISHHGRFFDRGNDQDAVAVPRADGHKIDIRDEHRQGRTVGGGKHTGLQHAAAQQNITIQFMRRGLGAVKHPLEEAVQRS